MCLSHLPEVGGAEAWGPGEGAEGPGPGAAKRTPVHRHSRAFLHALLHSDNTASLHHLTVHNIAYQVCPCPRHTGMAKGRQRGVRSWLTADISPQLRLMSAVRTSIMEKRFPDFVRDFMGTMYGDPTLCPAWATEALASVGITLH